MKIKIYQVNMERDENRVAFMAYESLAKFQGSPDVDSRIYDKVFEGEVNCFTLEKLYEIFNREHPAGYKGRSMSVSDVVEIVDGTTGKSYFHFCDSFGFQQVSFEPDKTQISERFCDGDKAETISVLLIQPGKYPKTVTIEDSLEAMQELVGGDIEEYMPFDDEAAIICNEEGKISGLPLNRAIYAEEEVDMRYSEMTQKFRKPRKTANIWRDISSLPRTALQKNIRWSPAPMRYPATTRLTVRIWAAILFTALRLTERIKMSAWKRI